MRKCARWWRSHSAERAKPLQSNRLASAGKRQLRIRRRVIAQPN
jgi:hypothetical protein